MSWSYKMCGLGVAWLTNRYRPYFCRTQPIISCLPTNINMKGITGTTTRTAEMQSAFQRYKAIRQMPFKM